MWAHVKILELYPLGQTIIRAVKGLFTAQLYTAVNYTLLFIIQVLKIKKNINLILFSLHTIHSLFLKSISYFLKKICESGLRITLARKDLVLKNVQLWLTSLSWKFTCIISTLFLKKKREIFFSIHIH